MKTLQTGDKVENFKALDQDGKTISLSDYKGKKLIVFFYPKANTPGCTTEACNLSDNYTMLKKQGYELLGVSADSQKRQKNFREKYQFPFPLIADENKEIINQFGVWGSKKFMGRVFDGIHRMTFVINEKGMIEKVIDKVKTKDHAAQIIESGLWVVGCGLWVVN